MFGVKIVEKKWKAYFIPITFFSVAVTVFEVNQQNLASLPEVLCCVYISQLLWNYHFEITNCDCTGTRPASSDQEDCSVQGHSENLSSDNLPSGDWLGTVQQFIIIVPSDPLVDNITETVITSWTAICGARLFLSCEVNTCAILYQSASLWCASEQSRCKTSSVDLTP